MPTHISNRREYPDRVSVGTVCMHALLAAVIIGTIAVAVVWAYS